MVLGLRSRKKRGASVQIDYVVSVLEIKPWPPSQSLQSVQSVLLSWQNGDKNSGSFIAVAGDASIVFNESFTLPLTLHPDKKARDKFQKNCLEFSLYEPRRDKGARGQLLGAATLNLSDYGVIEEILTIAAPMNCKKSSKNTPQPALYVRIEPLDKGSSRSSPNVRSSRTSLDHQDDPESMADLDGDDSGIASFTDDDISSHSSQTVASSAFEAARASPSQSGKNGRKLVNDCLGTDDQQSNSNGSFPPPASLILLSDTEHPVNCHNSSQSRDTTSGNNISYNPSIESSSSFIDYLHVTEKSEILKKNIQSDPDLHVSNEEDKKEGNTPENVKDEPIGRLTKLSPEREDSESEASVVNPIDVGRLNAGKKKEQKSSEMEDRFLGETRQSVDNLSRGGLRRIGTMGSTSTNGKPLGVEIPNGRLKHVKSQLYESAGRNGYFRNGHDTEMATKADIIRDAGNRAKKTKATESKKEITDKDTDSNRKSTAAFQNEQANESSNRKVQSDSRIQMLEEELREAATLEIGLYSVVAEHGSSVNKVHAPARRLSRFYLHACKEKSQAKIANAARAAISGLVLVSKACGNDVPRLTFWLSNVIMLRAIVSQAAAEITHLEHRHVRKTDSSMNQMQSSFRRRPDNYSSVEEGENNSSEESDDWEDIETFKFALEKTESWVFSRIVESIWWQTLTPHMQPTVAKSSGRTRGSSTKKTNTSRYGLGDPEQGNFSIELWKKAFKDACERLCPIRAGGHECGCLPVIARLVMEQLISRLDVAMFNAILRESSEEMPSDPVSDPISESRVLPIPAGKLSFGAGVQLKNAIGNWARWLSDIFGIEDGESPEDNNSGSDYRGHEAFKPFPLLNALSDLTMLPLEMLTDVPTRKEVCPILGPMLIKKVLFSYTPDEFCPNPIPRSVIEALDYEDASNDLTETATSHPCSAPPTVYSPPPETSLTCFMREVGNHPVQRSSSLLKKLYTSDDELDELDSPLTTIIPDSVQSSAPKKLNWITKRNSNGKVSRYHLLREVWKDYEQ